MPKKQPSLPGFEGPSYPDVDAAAEKFLAQRRAHAKSAQKSRDLRLKLIDEMKKAGVDEYRDNDAKPPIFITVEADSKVHVKELKGEAAPRKKAEPEKEAA